MIQARLQNRNTGLSLCCHGHGQRRGRRLTATLLEGVSSAPAVKAKDVPDAVAKPQAGHAVEASHASKLVPRRVKRTGPVTVAMLSDVRTMFASLLKEYTYWIDDAWVTGTIPHELCGTYYRNGPGLQVTNPRYRRHTLDGDGMVFSIAFKDGKAYFRNRFVRTKGFLAEQAAGRPLFRNSFTRGAVDGSQAFNPFDLNFKNVANTGVLPWGGQLYALWEAGLPYLMDPRTLETHRETRMGGQIHADTFSAHYRIVPDHHHHQQRRHNNQQHQELLWAALSTESCGTAGGRRLVAFSNEFNFTGAQVTFYEFDEDGHLLYETKQALPGVDIALIHDMVVTEHYYVLVLGPIRLEPLKFATQYMFGQCSIAECLMFDDRQPTRIMLYPRPGRPSGKVLSSRLLTAEPCFVFHNVNGFEAEDGNVLVVDAVAWDQVNFEMDLYDKESKRTDSFIGGGRTQLTRLTCDLRSGSVERRKLLQRTVEFPATDPRVISRQHRVAWFIADVVDDPVLWAPAQSVVRIDLGPELDRGKNGAAAAAAATTTVAAAASPAQAPEQLAPPQPPATAACGAEAAAEPGVSVDEWFLGDRTFPGEPMFAPRPGSTREGEGWLIVGVHNADTEKADVHIFDAEALSAGPVATLHLPHRLPVSLHGAWDPNYMGPDPDDAAVPRWQDLGSVKPL